MKLNRVLIIIICVLLHTSMWSSEHNDIINIGDFVELSKSTECISERPVEVNIDAIDLENNLTFTLDGELIHLHKQFYTLRTDRNFSVMYKNDTISLTMSVHKQNIIGNINTL